MIVAFFAYEVLIFRGFSKDLGLVGEGRYWGRFLGRFLASRRGWSIWPVDIVPDTSQATMFEDRTGWGAGGRGCSGGDAHEYIPTVLALASVLTWSPSRALLPQFAPLPGLAVGNLFRCGSKIVARVASRNLKLR